MKKWNLLILTLVISLSGYAEDGSRLWLRMNPTGKAKVETVNTSGDLNIATRELETYFSGQKATLKTDKTMPDDDGFSITKTDNGITICARRNIGLLYGTYEALRKQSLGEELTAGYSKPKFELRILNHWDNMDGSVERGYAGKSIWKWKEIGSDVHSTTKSMMYTLNAYARANASIGINGSVLNNVNASSNMLTAEYINKVKVIADVFRPYGIRVYLSVNFASPMLIGKLKTADPLNDKVSAWWRAKAKEIYATIPDFGGFLVKANSEGQPGPGDYKRSHADGANMLADAVEPYNGIIMWRSFVYGANHKGEDRVKQAVSEFKPCDGLFRKNVILQSKNGPLDFQPREPYAPIFDQIKQTPQMVELQITQEYTGQSMHLVYLAPMWKEFFSFVSPSNLKGIAGVANIGDDKNWCGHHFSQANWYAFGRLSWNPELASEDIAKEWLRQTFTNNPMFVDMMTGVMETSRETCNNYMMPLGLHHIFKFDHHYGPEPDGFKADYPIEWCPVYYHKADKEGVGFNRSSTGSNATSQYRRPYNSIYDNIETCPEDYLLWFHHVEWTHKMASGRTLWQELIARYNEGVAGAETYQYVWHNMMKPYVDEQRWQEVDKRLQMQADNAHEWRNTCLNYFGNFAKSNK